MSFGKKEAGGGEVAQGFRRHRDEARINLEELVKLSGVSERSLRTIESGELVSWRIFGPALQGLNELRRRKGHRTVRLLDEGGKQSLRVVEPGWLVFPEREWLRAVHGPGALLTADFRVVPFHGARSENELNQLAAWCQTVDHFRIRIYKGEGGMGKTRLAVELCHRLALPPAYHWTTGFAELKRFPFDSSPWRSLPESRKPLLIVVDYAGEEAKTKMIAELILHWADCPAPKVRLLFLERDDHWLDRLHEHRAIRDLSGGPLWPRTEEAAIALPPVAESSSERHESLRIAARAFAKKLDVRTPALPNLELNPGFYRSVLYLHMRAYLAVLGEEANSKSALLRQVFARERDYWKKRMEALGLPALLFPAVEGAVFKVAERNAVLDRQGALKLLAKAPFCRDQPKAVREQLFRVLRECYPQGATEIGPLQPDELRIFLVSQFSERL